MVCSLTLFCIEYMASIPNDSRQELQEMPTVGPTSTLL